MATFKAKPPERSNLIPAANTSMGQALVGLLARLKPFREVVLLVPTLAAGGLALHDYFATRTEVSILSCRSDADIAALDCKLEMDRLVISIAELEMRRGSKPLDSKASPSPEMLAATANDVALGLQLDAARAEYKIAEEKRRTAHQRLRPDICEELAKRKERFAALGSCSKR
ncbi:MAG: hypothetical protein IV094_10445 [Vitreoscilla sp.]|nr:hypothetical protein [Vitreoscilla sp.]